MYKKISLFVGLFVSFMRLDAIYPDIEFKSYPQIAQFVQEYRCPEDIEQLIVANSAMITSLGNNVSEYKYVPYFNKGAAFDRIINAKRLEKVIQQLGLDRIRVTKKWLCKGDDSWFVLAEKVTPSKQSLYPLTLQEIEQLIQLTQATGYQDYLKYHGENIVRDEQGYLVIIDTENRGFGNSCRESAARVIEYMLSERYWHQKLGLKLDVKTRQWLEKQRDILVFSQSYTFVPTLPNNTQYDGKIDLEKLEQEYECLQKEIAVAKLKQEYEALLAQMAMGK